MSAQLVITTPTRLRGRSFVLSADRVVIGRGGNSDLQIPDDCVSQHHAAISRYGQRTMLEDLGSTNGTSVNGRTVTAPLALRHGDVIEFGPVQLRFEEMTGRANGTRHYEPVRHEANFDVDRQQAGVINNVGRDQVIHMRDGFLREIAATKTKARRLIWFGVLLIVVGGGVFAAMVISFMSKVSGGLSNPERIPDFNTDFLGPAVGGVPIGLIGWAVAAIGGVLVIIGIVLHVVAAARRRKVDDAFLRPRTYPR
ncbi:FHA domain-containing protein [Kibdelosporangium aridum]|uniref:FHA domain-containing protein n=1 Tax=Kibdelosporangium aridum TaxID=2030 RepID=UPI0035EA7BF9